MRESALTYQLMVKVVVKVNVLVNVIIVVDGGVTLAWEPGTEPDTTGFNIYRLDAEGSYVKINGALIPKVISARGLHRQAGQWPRPSLYA